MIAPTYMAERVGSFPRPAPRQSHFRQVAAMYLIIGLVLWLQYRAARRWQIGSRESAG